MILGRIERRYWLLGVFEDGTVGAICKDGLLYIVENSEENRNKITSSYPVKTRKVWYFNASRDRECCEVAGDRITINPSAAKGVFGLFSINNNEA